MNTCSTPDGCCQSVLVTADEVAGQTFPEEAVVVVVSRDCIQAVDAAREAQNRHGIYIGDKADAELSEMASELYQRAH